MAKLKAPLLSLGASGKLGGVLVFFNWKGIDVVREYVVPTNPNTALQQTQRGYITAAVAMVHTAQARAANALDSADQVAYSNLANALGKVMTWFNMACKLWLDVKRATEIPCVYSNGHTSNPLTTSIYAILYLNEETASQLAAGKFYFGTTRTNLINAVTATLSIGAHIRVDNVDCSAFLTAGIKYYWQFRPDAGDPCEGADSGIYYFYAT